MRTRVWAATFLVLAAVACTSARGTGEAEAANSSTVCVETLRFADNDHRSAFLDTNADRIIAQTATDALFVVSEISTPTLELTAAANTTACPPEGLAAAYGLQGDFQVTTRLISTQEAHSRLEQTLALNLTGTESDVHRCIVRTDRAGLDQFGLMSRRLWFSGLRRAHLQGAEGVIYIAAEEPCELLLRLAAAAMNNLEFADPQFASCRESSFRGCGYPKDITFGRWSDPSHGTP